MVGLDVCSHAQRAIRCTFRGKCLANGGTLCVFGQCVGWECVLCVLGAGLAWSQDGMHDAVAPSASGARLRRYVSFVRAVKIRGGAGGRGGRGYCATGWESGWGMHGITLARGGEGLRMDEETSLRVRAGVGGRCVRCIEVSTV